MYHWKLILGCVFEREAVLLYYYSTTPLLNTVLSSSVVYTSGPSEETRPPHIQTGV